jgi:thiamine biosynthesis lipoprotein
LTLLALVLLAVAVPPVTVERHLVLMGTSLEITVEADTRERALAASERAVAALQTAEARLSTWRDDTELARLNRTPAGQPLSLSPVLAADLGAARRCWEETGGAFDPGIGALIEAWGLRQGGRMPAEAERRAALAAGGLDGLRLGPGLVAVRERAGLVLEEGGFGKGAGLGDALAAASGGGVSRVALNLGGQLAVAGNGRWSVPVADPRERKRAVLALSIDRGSVSTSGNSERGTGAGGHILDPRTGEPVPDFGSVTVWAGDPLRADCLSTGLYVMGPERALAWAAEHPGVEVLVLRPRGHRLEALATPGLEGNLEVLEERVEVTFSRSRKAG